jgi:hypothetical protein
MPRSLSAFATPRADSTPSDLIEAIVAARPAARFVGVGLDRLDAGCAAISAQMLRAVRIAEAASRSSG